MTAYTLKFSRAAENSLRHIYQYIAADSPENAERFVSKIQTEAVDFLTTIPLAGRLYKDNLRFMTFHHYVFLYRCQYSEVTVIDVYAPGRNWR